MHEIIYREARQLGAKNSKRARFFNSLLAANHWATWEDELGGWSGYVQTLRDLNLSTEYSWRYVADDGRAYVNRLDLADSYFYEDGSLEEIAFYIPYHHSFPSWIYAPVLDSCQPLFGQEPRLPVGGGASFFRNGCLRELRLDYNNPSYIDIANRSDARLFGGTRARASYLAFAEDGHLVCMVLSRAADLVRASDGGIVSLPSDSIAFFDETRKVTSYHLPESGELVMCMPGEDSETTR